MKKTLLAILMSCVCLGRASGAESPAVTPQGLDFQAFKLILDRNIFDPARRPPSRGPRERPVRVQSFSLLGTMIYDQATYAFFGGSEPNYNTVLNPSNSIAGFKIEDVTLNSVKLCSGTNTFDLSIGKQMRKVDDGDWQLVSGTSSGSASLASRSDASAGGDDVTDPVLKRLMQRRQQDDSGGAPAATTASVVGKPAEETSNGDSVSDPVLKRLMQRREQEEK